MANRLDLQAYFETLTQNVYYQPPASVKMKYPAIRYSRMNINNDFADDSVYRQDRSYEVTVMDYNPDSTIVDEISKLPRCRFNRHYTADGLNHDVFVLYY